MNPVIQDITAKQLIINRDNFKVGDGVKVHVKVRERRYGAHSDFFPVSSLLKNIPGFPLHLPSPGLSPAMGVERVLPLHSPSIAQIEVERVSVPMRAKL
jgi:large subunit ribosomal protein L19